MRVYVYFVQSNNKDIDTRKTLSTFIIFDFFILENILEKLNFGIYTWNNLDSPGVLPLDINYSFMKIAQKYLLK